MIKQAVKKTLSQFGYEVYKVERRRGNAQLAPSTVPAPIEPAWPLPRKPGGLSDEEIRKRFAEFEQWHYAYEFEGGLSFQTRHHNPQPLADASERPLQRFRHFMPYVLAAYGGSLAGKRVLDIACNSSFWSIQFALLGAQVTGFDARPELIAQANLIKSIVGVDNAQFRVLDFWDMAPETLGGTFDLVLSLGILYHLPKPLEALELTRAMAKDHILLDTGVFPSGNSLIKLRWEEPHDIRSASSSGIVAYPSKPAIEAMLRHIGVDQWFEIPLRTAMPPDYHDGRRATWLIKV